MINFFKHATINTSKNLLNTLLNGFESNLTNEDKVKRIGIKLCHFNPFNVWAAKDGCIVDKCCKNKYCNDSENTVALKCGALFLATIFIQPLALSINIANRVAKLFTLAQLWNPSKERYSFKARIKEFSKDLLIVIATPLSLIGMLFSSLYGLISPYNGRKLYATCERFTYSGGYKVFKLFSKEKEMHNFVLAPCFQPEPQGHLGGGDVGMSDKW